MWNIHLRKFHIKTIHTSGDANLWQLQHLFELKVRIDLHQLILQKKVWIQSHLVVVILSTFSSINKRRGFFGNILFYRVEKEMISTALFRSRIFTTAGTGHIMVCLWDVLWPFWGYKWTAGDLRRQRTRPTTPIDPEQYLVFCLRLAKLLYSLQ